MRFYVTLTVEFNEPLSAETRTRFDESMEEAQWQKSDLATTWTARFKKKYDAEEALRIAKRHVKKAAAVAGITDYAAAAQAGKEQPAIWKRP